jgi:hypothetical protein
MQVNVADNTSASAMFLNLWVEKQFCVGSLKKINEPTFIYILTAVFYMTSLAVTMQQG